MVNKKSDAYREAISWNAKLKFLFKVIGGILVGWYLNEGFEGNYLSSAIGCLGGLVLIWVSEIRRLSIISNAMIKKQTVKVNEHKE